MRWYYYKGEKKRTPKRYKTINDSYKDCEKIWGLYYKQLPNIKLASRWTGNDHPNHWLNNFYYYYNKF